MRWFSLLALMIALAFGLFLPQAHAEPVKGKRVLFIITSHSEIPGTGKKTGVWMEELATPYQLFQKAGLSITLASIRGGRPPIDPRSEDKAPPSVQAFKSDASAMAAFSDTTPLSKLNAKDYDAVFLPGGHGAAWDFANNPVLTAFLQTMLDQKKPIAALCHGPVALLELQDATGKPYLSGRRATGFSKAEEAAVGLDTAVPSYLDKQLAMVGAKVELAPPFKPKVLRDGGIATGQNPASSEGLAKLMLAMLKGK